MPNIFKRLDGVINNIFSIGLKNNKTTILSTDSALNVDNNIDVGSNKFKTTSTPVDDNDVVTLSFVKQHNANCSRIYCQDFTNSATIAQSVHGINSSCIIKNIVIDVTEAYNTTAFISIALGDTELVDSQSVNLGAIAQYQNSTFYSLSSTGDLKVIFNNATTVGKIKLYIEYVNQQ